ncbi:uncharacterized protein LOC141664776 [Apium graveolens]|uniref:uncharacterized protein LOC141664776 n=1 Tax=Apium graveolens TaxID=4045 RepID=UPI003D78E1C0
MEDNLPLVNITRTDWRVRARITRMWPSFSRIQQFRGVNLIVLDLEDCHVFAFVNRVIWHDVSNIILEGNIYDIHNFVVMEPAGLMRHANLTENQRSVGQDGLEALYQFHQNPFEVTSDRFHGFIAFVVPNNVDQAMFYNSVQNLFLRQNIDHHLAVLAHISVSPRINQTPLSSTNCSRDSTYTIWMKSLLFNGCGCTIFNSDGEIVYRIDNYNKKCGSQVQLMNLHGEVLLLLRRKRFRIFEEWEGFRLNVISGDMRRQKPWFNVRRDCKILRRSMTSCHVRFGCDHKVRGNGYRIVGFPGKSELKIIRGENQLVAEVKRKQSCSGVILGEDVLSLRVEALPQINHLLIMALVIVYGLIEEQL